MMKRIFWAAMTIVFVLTFITACGDPENGEQDSSGSITAESVFDLLGNFKFDTTANTGYKYVHTQKINGKQTNSKEVELHLESSNKGIWQQTIRSLNPDVTGSEYLEESTVLTFNADTVMEDGVATDKYTVAELVSLKLIDISTYKSKLENVSFDGSVLKFTIPQSYVKAAIKDGNGVNAVHVQITLNEDKTAIEIFAIHYTRAEIETFTEIKINK